MEGSERQLLEIRKLTNFGTTQLKKDPVKQSIRNVNFNALQTLVSRIVGVEARKITPFTFITVQP